MKPGQSTGHLSHPIRAALLALLILVPTVLMGSLLYLYSLQPRLSGRLHLAGLREEVEVIFDTYAIPHIYGQNREDVYFALGHVHAQERLFQMEMMRRVAAGRRGRKKFRFIPPIIRWRQRPCLTRFTRLSQIFRWRRGPAVTDGLFQAEKRNPAG